MNIDNERDVVVENYEESFDDIIKRDFSNPIHISENIELTQELADQMEIDFDNPLTNNPGVRIMPFGKPQFFDCYLPENYFVSQKGIWKITKKYDKASDKDVFSTELICTSRAMPTGYFIDEDNSDVVEITYFTDTAIETMHVPLNATLGVKEWKELVRKNNIGRLDITDDELRPMINFFKAARKENVGVHVGEDGTAFKSGYSYFRSGWKNDDFSILVAGHRMFCDDNGKLVEKECIFTDVNAAHTYDPRGSIEEWVKAVRPIMDYNRVRFAIYAAFSSLLLHYFNTDSFVIDLYGGIPGKINDKSSSGKTTMVIVSLSGIGNVVPGNCDSLFNVCISTDNFVENISAKHCDFPIGLDEDTNLKKEIRERLVYRISNTGTKGKASDGKGGTQLIRRKHNVVLATGEDPLIPANANIGAKVRSPKIRGGIGVYNIGKLVTAAREGCRKNSGHLLEPFVAEFFKNKSNLYDYFNEIRDKLDDSTDSDLAKRQASYFAAITAAGKLLEPIFAKIGIEEKNPYEVVYDIWNDCILSNPIDSQWRQALEEVMGWYAANRKSNFNLGKGATRQLYGWKSIGNGGEVVSINKTILDAFLTNQREGRNYDPDNIYESWRAEGLTNVNKPKQKKDKNGNIIGEYKPYTYLTVTKNGDNVSVIQLILGKVYDTLGYNPEQNSGEIDPEEQVRNAVDAMFS
jgi:uncharacterized protein (DUF927 family)